MCAKPLPPAEAYAELVCVGDDVVWCPCRRKFTLHVRTVDVYEVRPIRGCDGGRGFTVEKHAGGDVESSYDVFLADEGGHDSCECWSFLRWGHQRPCRHLNALRQLVAAGHLAEPNPLAAAPAAPAVTEADVDAMAEYFGADAADETADRVAATGSAPIPTAGFAGYHPPREAAMRPVTVGGKRYRVTVRSWDGRAEVRGPGMVVPAVLPDGVTLDAPDLRPLVAAAVARSRENHRRASEAVREAVANGLMEPAARPV